MNGHGSYLSHMTIIMLLMFISLLLKSYIQNVVKIGPVLSGKSFNFHMLMTFGQGQNNLYTRIPS